MATAYKYRELKGHPTSRKALVSDGNERLVLVDLKAPGKAVRLPLQPDTGPRFHYHSGANACLVGSWRRGIKCFDVATGGMIWENSKLAKIDNASVLEERGAFLLEGDTTYLVDAKRGHTIRKWPNRQVWIHPAKEFFISTKRSCGTVELTNEALDKSWQFEWDSFGVLAVAWGERTVACSSPSGHLAIVSLTTGEVVAMIKSPDWFNVLRLCYNWHTRTHYGIATGWKDKPELGLISIGESNGNFALIKVLENAIGFDFLNHGSELITTDGKVFSTETGQIVMDEIPSLWS